MDNWKNRYSAKDADSMTRDEWLFKYQSNWSAHSKNCKGGHQGELPCANCYLKKNKDARYRQRFPKFVREYLSKKGLIEDTDYETGTRVNVDNEVADTRSAAKDYAESRLSAGEHPELIAGEMQEREGDEEGRQEGQLVRRVQKRVRRNKEVRKVKLASVRENNNGSLICEGCGRDLERNDRAEIHHEFPLKYQDKEYQIDPVNDTACYCANCHAYAGMIEQGTRDDTDIGVNLTSAQLRNLYGKFKTEKSTVEGHLANVLNKNGASNTRQFFESL